MPDPFKARPVSGEIMTGPGAETGRPFGATRNDRHGIMEAEFETLRPVTGFYGLSGGAANAPEGVGLLRNESRPDHRERGGFAFWMTGAALIILAFLASGGYILVNGGRHGPSAESRASESFHTASVSLADREGQEGSFKPDFLGTSEERVKSQGSFVFSDTLDGPKDEGKSVSSSFSKE
jgi:hypothetical protein